MIGRVNCRQSLNEPVFIGFAGRTGAGKTSAASYLSSKFDFQYLRYSKVLQEWLSDTPEREKLQEIGWDVMARGMQSELNSRLIAEVDLSRGAAIDGLRHPLDFQQLRTAFGSSFHLVFLDACTATRFKRRERQFPDFAGFQAAEVHPVESLIDDLQSQASVTISNEGSLEELHQRMDSFVEGIGKGACK